MEVVCRQRANWLIEPGEYAIYWDDKDFLQKNSAQLVTTWPVIIEVSHMLDFDIRAQVDFLRWITVGEVVVHNIDVEYLERIIQLTEKYLDCSMDLADAKLVVTAELITIKEIISIDRDFNVYRIANNKYIRNVFLEN